MSLTEVFKEIEIRHQETQQAFQATDNYDALGALKEARSLFSLTENVQYLCQRWKVLWLAQGSPASENKQHEYVKNIELTIGLTFSRFCDWILFQNLSEYFTKDLQRLKLANQKALEKCLKA